MIKVYKEGDLVVLSGISSTSKWHKYRHILLWKTYRILSTEAKPLVDNPSWYQVGLEPVSPSKEVKEMLFMEAKNKKHFTIAKCALKPFRHDLVKKEVHIENNYDRYKDTLFKANRDLNLDLKGKLNEDGREILDPFDKEAWSIVSETFNVIYRNHDTKSKRWNKVITVYPFTTDKRIEFRPSIRTKAFHEKYIIGRTYE